MPDTGFMSPDNVVSTTSTFFNNFWINEGGGVIIFFATNGTQTVDGFENDGASLPGGATITGAEVKLKDTYVSSGTGTFDIQISIDGGSSFSSSITSGTIGTDSGISYTLGGSSNLWGLDWSSFSDLSQLQVKGLNGSLNIISDHVYIKLHYAGGTVSETLARLSIKGSTLSLKGGTFTIK